MRGMSLRGRARGPTPADRPPSAPTGVNKGPREVRRHRLHETPNCVYSLG